ncbi:MAG: metallophosphoesterase [Nitrospirae bacterium]|nr:metallophosphoesterase [Nitrospirota bacterium]
MYQNKRVFCSKAVIAFSLSIILFATMIVGLSGCGSSSAEATPVFKFAVFDDSRAASGATGTKNGDSNGAAAQIVKTIATDIAAQGVDFVLFPGDMVSGYTDSTTLSSELDTWKTAMAPVYNANIPVYTTRGNHEYDDLTNGASNPDDPSRATYLAHFVMPTNGPTKNGAGLSEVGLTYSFTWKGVKFIAFDNYAGRTTSFDNTKYAPGSNKGQMMSSWVLDEINNSTAGLNFVMSHEMMWPTTSHPDCLANDPDDRDALVTALAAKNGTYFAGHNHMWVRGTMSDGKGAKIPAFTIGTGGGGNYDYAVYDVVKQGYTGSSSYSIQQVRASSANPVFGYMLVTVYSDNTWKGEFRAFQYNKWNDATDHSTTAITVWDSFMNTDMLK